ncbi:MAG TPA: DUF2844 domain-containing protein [Terriglobales bacterium]|nr:DUF2844 domain-containing protein [Terriglobales bacterium]
MAGRAACWVLAVSVLLSSLPALAELGGDEGSVQADAMQMKAQRRIERTQAYVMHEMHTPPGTVVREYVSSSGKVFAVSWQGPTTPDFRQLLGAYYDQLQNAQLTRNERGPLLIHQPGLVFHSGGHMRAFSGRAYIPDMVPAGVALEAIR